MPVTPCRPAWKGTMSARERFNRQMHFQSVDRCFNMEFGYWDENFTQWPIFVENGIETNGQADQFFNFDRRAGIGGKIGFLPHFRVETIRENETSRIIRNKDGLMAEMPKDGHSTIPHFTEATIKTPDDWREAKKERFDRNSPGRKVDIEAMKKRHPEDRDYPLGVNGGSMIGRIRDFLTLEGFVYACTDYPDMVEDMVEQHCLLVEDFLDRVLPHFQFDYATGWEDIACNNGPLVNMDFFKNVIAPRYKRIGAKLRAAGIDVWYTDCDGDIRQMLPTFLECGINCMFPFEINGCGHPGPLLEEYGKDLLIMGGVDKGELAKGPEAIKIHLESLAPYVARGGFIPFCDHRCPPNVKQEDYIYYLDLKERMFGM